MGARAVVRRGNGVIYVHDVEWARQLVFGESENRMEVDSCVLLVAKKVLDQMKIIFFILVFGRFPAELGPATPLNGSGSKNGA